MSRNLFIVICSLLLCDAVGQSDSSGIFLSATDYEQNRLTLPVSCNSMKNSVKPHEQLRKQTIHVRFEGKKYRYSKSAIFGYRNCEKKSFRFFLDEAYEILNTDGFWLYRQRVEKDYWEVYRSYDVFYFSKDPYSIIYPLNKHDLKWIFKERRQFVEALDSSFRSEDDLSSFNSKKKRYRIIEAFLKE